jgi:3-hydroxyacyl-CoA dehydrogenase
VSEWRRRRNHSTPGRTAANQGHSSFYDRKEGRTYFFDLGAGQYQEIKEKPEIIFLPSLKDQKKTVLSNPGASLIDLGDGVACLEFHSKMNTIGADTILMIRQALEEVEKISDGYRNQSENCLQEPT